MKRVQILVKHSTCHCHFLLIRPITVKKGQDKCHTDTTSYWTTIVKLILLVSCSINVCTRWHPQTTTIVIWKLMLTKAFHLWCVCHITFTDILYNSKQSVLTERNFCLWSALKRTKLAVLRKAVFFLRFGGHMALKRQFTQKFKCAVIFTHPQAIQDVDDFWVEQ